MTLNDRTRGAALIALSSLFFAAMAVVARTLAGQMSAGQLVLIRFIVGLAGTGVIFAARRQLPRIPRPANWAMRGLLGGSAVYCYFVAIEHLGVGPATLLNYAAPIYAAVFAAIFLSERPTVHLVAGLVVSTVGAGLVAFGTADPAHPFSLSYGAWFGVASAILSGGAMVTIKGLRADTDATTIFFAFCVFGAAIAVPFAVRAWSPLTAEMLLRALAVGVLSFIAQLIFTYAFKFVTAAAGSAATQLTPAFSWVMAAAFLDERPNALTAIGAALCVAGVLWGVLAGSRRT